MYDLFFETEKRGTPDFPIEFFHVTSAHPRYRMRTQWHNDIEIDRVIKGKLTIRLNDGQFVMREGDCVVVPGGVVHSAEAEECVYECAVFAPNVLYATQSMRNRVKTSFERPVFLKNDESVGMLFDCLSKKRDGEEFSVMSSLYAVMHKALSRQKNVSVKSSEYKIERIKPAISYIEENYMKNISLKTLAKVCSMSPNYFCSFFREVMGQTPVQYITASRIEAACEKLVGGASVTESALSCGFNDISYFIRLFKKEMSQSPKKYAEKHIKKRQG